MPAARYWRVSQVQPYLMGGLTLSDIALYEGATRMDGSATLSCTVTPDSGTMWTSAVTWAESSVNLPCFAFVWDFGSAQTVDKVGIAGPAQSTFIGTFNLEYSTDSSNWTVLFVNANTTFPGEATLFTITLEEVIAQKTVLLLHADGTNGSTVILDSSLNAKTITTDTAITTSNKKFGSASINCSTLTNKYLKVDAHSELYLGYDDFTIEMFFYKISGSSATYQRLLQIGSNSTNGGLWVVANRGVGNECKPFVDSYTGGYSSPAGLSSTITQDEWHHLAVTRSGETFKIWIDGVLAASGSKYYKVENYNVYIGSNENSAELFNGYIDEVRITKQAIYTENFTPPAYAFVNPVAYDSTRLRGRSLAEATLIGSSPIGDTQVIAPAVTTAIDREDGGLCRITGTVKEKSNPSNIPLKRKVRLHRENDGRMIRETWSDATTGEYTFDYIRGDASYFVTTFDYLHNYRAVIADNLTAELMP